MSLKNAKIELLATLSVINKKEEDIEWLRVVFGECCSDNLIIDSIEGLNRLYDARYGNANLLGFVMFLDGTWLERHEYDGATWWEYKTKPKKEDWEESDDWEYFQCRYRIEDGYKGI